MTHPEAKRIVVGRATGLSMWPALLPDDVALVTPGTPKVGDIALFGEVLHRVILVEPSGHVWERGDAIPWARRRKPRDVRGILRSVGRNGTFIDPPTRKPALADYLTILHAGGRALARRLLRR